MVGPTLSDGDVLDTEVSVFFGLICFLEEEAEAVWIWDNEDPSEPSEPSSLTFAADLVPRVDLLGLVLGRLDLENISSGSELTSGSLFVVSFWPASRPLRPFRFEPLLGSAFRCLVVLSAMASRFFSSFSKSFSGSHRFRLELLLLELLVAVAADEALERGRFEAEEGVVGGWESRSERSSADVLVSGVERLRVGRSAPLVCFPTPIAYKAPWCDL